MHVESFFNWSFKWQADCVDFKLVVDLNIEQLISKTQKLNLPKMQQLKQKKKEKNFFSFDNPKRNLKSSFKFIDWEIKFGKEIDESYFVKTCYLFGK